MRNRRVERNERKSRIEDKRREQETRREQRFYKKSLDGWISMLVDYAKRKCGKCAVCGVYIDRSGSKKYCDKCARDVHNEQMRAYLKREKEAKNEYKRQYMKDHPDKRREKERKKIAKKKNVPGFHTEEEWINLVDLCNYTCVFCLQPFDIEELTRDHIIPITITGTSDNISNIQPACRKCNASKGNRETVDRRPEVAVRYFKGILSE